MQKRICSKCHEEKNTDEFYAKSGNVCKSCRRLYCRNWTIKSRDYLHEYKKKFREQDIKRAVQWNKDNPERRNQIALNYYYRLRNEAILAYGGYKCACCGETEPMFLTLDHINNDGNKHRKELGKVVGARFYKHLRDKGYPPGFQVLCMNCNHGKMRNHGICPHQDT